MLCPYRENLCKILVKNSTKLNLRESEYSIFIVVINITIYK